MNERGGLVWLAAVAGFFVVAAFGMGVIATAAYNGQSPFSAAGEVAQQVTGTAPQTIDVELGELFIKPATIQASAGDISFNVTNSGAAVHNFAVEGLGKTEMIDGGSSTTLELTDVKAGTYKVICEVAGHETGGMTATLVVGGAAASKGETASGHEGHGAMTPEQMVKVDAAVTAEFPAETKGQGGQELEYTMQDGFKVFEVTAEEIEWEVEPGVFKKAMAYNGQVPGPTIRVDLGDKVRVVLHNEMSVPTTIHHHGLLVPANMDGVPVISQDAVLPDESFTYEFTVRNSGTHMYHSHFMADEQVPAGLLGAFIVNDPKDPQVDQDVNMVLNDGPLGFTLNGKGFPATAPIVADRGELIRIRYMNEGMQIHPMHLHGIQQKVIARDGVLLERPQTMDTVTVAPGERVDVLVRASEVGTWAYHCHVLNHAESPDGMFGMVTAMVVQ